MANVIALLQAIILKKLFLDKKNIDFVYYTEEYISIDNTVALNASIINDICSAAKILAIVGEYLGIKISDDYIAIEK